MILMQGAGWEARWVDGTLVANPQIEEAVTWAMERAALLADPFAYEPDPLLARIQDAAQLLDARVVDEDPPWPDGDEAPAPERITEHLPGQHNQKDHAGGGAGASVPPAGSSGGLGDIGIPTNVNDKTAGDVLARAHISAGGSPILDSASGEEKLKDMTVTALAERAGVSYDLANAFVKQWAYSANDSDMRSLSIQRDAADEFGVELSPFQKQQIATLEADASIATNPASLAVGARLSENYSNLVAMNYKNMDELAGAAGTDVPTLKKVFLDAVRLRSTALGDDDETAAEAQQDEADNFDAAVTPHPYASSHGDIMRIGIVIAGQFSVVGPDDPTAKYKALADAPTQRKMLRAMYDLTQESLAKQGVDDITVWRGTGGVEVGHRRGQGLPNAGDYVPVTGKLGALSSWSARRQTAFNFAGDGRGTIASARIPRSRILSYPGTGFGCLHEAEFVVIGGGEFPMLAQGVH